MMDHMTKDDSVTKLALKKGQRSAIMLNNLGGCSMLEMNIVAKETLEWLRMTYKTLCAYCEALFCKARMRLSWRKCMWEAL